jgi:hypothetical protein
MPSTYTTNLGIEKIATGEQSGTWGTTTNTNLDLIDTAVNGIVSITLASAGTSGSPNDLPITDGTASNGRNKFIEFVDGGDLGATAYVQLTPNDAEKIVHIRNSLSGSRSIIVFQGTYNASNDFEIPNGADVTLKFNGAGAGATVTDVNVDLTVTGATIATADINGGTIDGTVIGGSSAAAGTFTTFTSTGIDDNATSTAITIDSSQNVGIGTISVATKLNIRTDASDDGILLEKTDGTDIARLFHDGATTNGRFDLFSGGSAAVQIRANGDTHFSGGNVGIGTSSPATKLAVSGGYISQTDGTRTLYLGSDGTGGLFGTITNDYLRFVTNNTERMRIDSSGNVGIGTTPSGWGGALDAIDVGPYGSFSADNDTTFITNNAYYNGSNWIYKNSNLAGRYRQQQGIHVWDTAASGTAGGTLTFSERMRIDSSGNVGIGTASSNISAGASGSTALTISASTADNGNRNGLLELRGTRSTTGNIVSYMRTFNNSATTPITDIQSIRGSADTLGEMAFLTSNTERMRLDSSGNLLIGTTTVPTTIGGSAFVANTDARYVLILGVNTSAPRTLAQFNNSLGNVGSISTTSYSTAYNTSSDVRLKENIVDAPSASDDIDAIQIRSYDWKADGQHQKYGVVAQELVNVAPEAVSQGETEEDTWGVDYSKLVPMLVKEIQDLRKRVADLEG